MGLALPIIGGMISQNVLNLVDTAMVGSLGDAALAGVGIGSFVNFMAVAFIIGMAAGVQAMAARRKGEGRLTETAVPLNGGLVLAATLAIPASIVLFLLVPHFFPLLENDPQVVQLGGDYLRCRLVAMTAVGMNFAFRGYWNAVDRSRLYLRTLVVMHVVNIVLNYLLIFGKFGLPELGVVGAGIGTAASTYVGLAYYIYLGLRHARENGFLRGLPERTTMRSMLRLSVPAGVQQFLFATGMTVFFTMVGKLGTKELAAANVLVNLMLVAILPAMGFGLAAATLVGQALGRGDVVDARRWGFDVVQLSMGVLLLIAIPGFIWPELLLAPFVHNPETLALATTPLRLVAGSVVFESAGMVLLNALLGAGDTRRVMVVAVGVQWFVMLPLVYLVGPVWGMGLSAIFAVQLGSRILQAGVFILMWRKDGWTQIKV
ncbi:MAG: MATE family efflux transporter [Myxococcales bacterium]|nr:MATE family efflux transporter [Myxococcales bacterium]